MDFSVGDVVYMKKAHPCGSHEWAVLRVGMDFRIKCAKCGHLVMLPRPKFEKSVKKVISKEGVAKSSAANNEERAKE